MGRVGMVAAMEACTLRFGWGIIRVAFAVRVSAVVALISMVGWVVGEGVGRCGRGGLGIGMELGFGGECVFVCSMGRSGSVEWVGELVVGLLGEGWVR